MADRKKNDKAKRQVVYRGQVVKQPSAGSSSVEPLSPAEVEARQAIDKLKQLFHEGLITREEAETRRNKILAELKRATG